MWRECNLVKQLLFILFILSVSSFHLYGAQGVSVTNYELKPFKIVLTHVFFCFSIQNIISRLEQSPALSFSGRLLLVLSIIQHADIRPPSHESSTLPYLNDSLSVYKRAMTYLLDQVIKLVSICASCAGVLCPYSCHHFASLFPSFASCVAILRRHLAPPFLLLITCAAILRHHIAPP